MILMAVDPGSSKVGVSVFDGDELIYCARLNFESSYEKFTERLNDILEKLFHEFDRLIHKYRITHICWEIVPAIGNMSHKDFVVSTGSMLKCMAFRYRLIWQGIAAITAKKVVVGNHKATKIQVRTKVLELQPDLMDRFGVRFGQYDAFDSVIIGLACKQKGGWRHPLETTLNGRDW